MGSFGVLVPKTTKILELLSPTREILEENYRQLGRVAVIGGSHGNASASYFAAISALKLGAAASSVFCPEGAAPVIQSYNPELVVKPVLFESYSLSNVDQANAAQMVIEDVVTRVVQYDCLVIGPGLGHDQFLLYCVSEIMKRARQAGIAMVIDGDGFYLVRNDINLIKDYPLVVLPLDTSEFKKFALTVLGMDLNNEDDVLEQLPSLSKELGGVTILLKQRFDYVTDGNEVYRIGDFGCPRKCSQDAYPLSGSIALFIAWARLRAANDPWSQTVLGCLAASPVFRHAGECAFRNKKRSTLTSDIIENLGHSLEELCPLEKDEVEEEEE